MEDEMEKKRKGRERAVDALFQTNFGNDIDIQKAVDEIKNKIDFMDSTQPENQKSKRTDSKRIKFVNNSKIRKRTTYRQKKSSIPFVWISLAAGIAMIAAVIFVKSNEKPTNSRITIPLIKFKIATVSSTSSKSTIIREGKKVIVKRDTSLFLNDKLLIADGDKVSFIYPDKTKITGYNNAKILFKKKSSGGKMLLLNYGRIKADVTKQKQGQQMVFVTPFSKAKILGTKFFLDVNDNESRLDVEEGKIRFIRNEDSKSLNLNAGQYAIVSNDVSQDFILQSRYKNLISNGNFEDRLNGWFIDNGKYPAERGEYNRVIKKFSFINKNRFDINYSKISREGWSLNLKSNDLKNIVVSQKVLLRSNVDYRFEGWIKCTAAPEVSYNFTVMVYCLDESSVWNDEIRRWNGAIKTFIRNDGMKGSIDWKKYTFKFAVPENTKEVWLTLQLRVNKKSSEGINNKVEGWIDDLSITQWIDDLSITQKKFY